MGCVISYANEWEEYSNYVREGVGISRNGALPTLGPSPSTWERSWHLWVRHEAQGLLESPFHHLGSNQCTTYPQLLWHSFFFFFLLNLASYPDVLFFIVQKNLFLSCDYQIKLSSQMDAQRLC